MLKTSIRRVRKSVNEVQSGAVRSITAQKDPGRIPGAIALPCNRKLSTSVHGNDRIVLIAARGFIDAELRTQSRSICGKSSGVDSFSVTILILNLFMGLIFVKYSGS